MITSSPIMTRLGQTRKSRFLNGFGLLCLIVSVLTGLIEYGLGPLFTDKPIQVISPGLHFTLLVVSIFLIWLGSGEAIKAHVRRIDNSLREYLAYRVLRLIVAKVFGILGFVLSVLFHAWIDPSRNPRESSFGDRERTADDIWDNHPKHYYDNDPPSPFT